MNEVVEDQLINMGKHLIKIHKHKMAACDSKQLNLSETNGKIDLALLAVSAPTHTAHLKLENMKEFHVSKFILIRQKYS